MPNATKTEHISNTFRGFVGLRIPASFHPHSFLLKKIVVRPLIGHNITQEPSDWPGRIRHSPEALPEPGDRNNLEGTNQLAAMSNIQTEHNYIMVSLYQLTNRDKTDVFSNIAPDVVKDVDV